MTTDKIFWQSRCLDAETVRDAAERFVQEAFGVQRNIVWGQTPGEFRFADGYWFYQLSCECGHWYVRRTDRKTPQGAARERPTGFPFDGQGEKQGDSH